MVEYVEQRNGGFYVGQSRVSLHSLIAAWRRRGTPESIQEGYPHLPLAAIYGAIAYYLEHQVEMDASFAQDNAQFERARAAQQAADPEFYANMRRRMSEARDRLRMSEQAGELPSTEPATTEQAQQ